MKPSPAPTLLAPALVALLLAACAGSEAPPQRGSGATPAAAPARPSAPITRYDGAFAGSVSATTSAYTCAVPVRGTRGLVVNNGRVEADMTPGRGAPMRGAVQEDGSLRATDPIDRSNAVSGQIIGDQFVGAWANGRCNYTLNFRRLN